MGGCEEIKKLMEKEYRKLLDEAIVRARNKVSELESVEGYGLANTVYRYLNSNVPSLEKKLRKAVQKGVEPELRTILASVAYIALVDGGDPHMLRDAFGSIYDAMKNYTRADTQNQMKQIISQLDDVIEESEKSLKDLLLSGYFKGHSINAIYDFIKKHDETSSKFAEIRYGVLRNVESMTGQTQFLEPKMPQFYEDLDEICGTLERIRDRVLYNPEEEKYTYVSYTVENINNMFGFPLMWLLEKSIERNHGELKREKDGKFATKPRIVKTSDIEVIYEFSFLDPAMIFAVVVKTPDPERYSYPRTIKDAILETIRVRDLVLARNIEDSIYTELRNYGVEDEKMIYHIHGLAEKIRGEKEDKIIESTGIKHKVREMLHSVGIDMNSPRKKKGRAKAEEILVAVEYLIQARDLNIPHLTAASRVFANKSKFIPYILEKVGYRSKDGGELLEC